jgi:hypothetical protein
MNALDKEITVIKSELDQIREIRLKRMKSVEVCMKNVTKRVMEEPDKV